MIMLLVRVLFFCMISCGVIKTEVSSFSEKQLLKSRAQELEPMIVAKQRELDVIIEQREHKKEALALAVSKYQIQENAKVMALEGNLPQNTISEINERVETALDNVKDATFEVQLLQDKVSSLNIIVLQPLLDEYFTILMKLGESDRVREIITQLDDTMYAALKAKIFYLMGASWIAWVYGKNTKVGFEIVNSYDEPIWITLLSDNKPIIENKKVNAKGLLSYGRVSAEIDIYKKSNQLLIYRQDIKKMEGNVAAQYQFTPGKTIYVRWDGNQLIPQQDGLIQKKTNMTSSGYSLKFNVTQENIFNRKIEQKKIAEPAQETVEVIESTE